MELGYWTINGIMILIFSKFLGWRSQCTALYTKPKMFEENRCLDGY